MRHILPVLAVLWLTSCEHRGAMVSAPASTPIVGGFITPPQDAQEAAPLPEPKIVRTGELRFRVVDLETTRAVILERTKAHTGYVAGDSRDQTGGSLRLTLRVRIPAALFDAFLESIQDTGTLEHRQLDAADATAQWLDLEARLGAKAEIERRHLELVQRATNVGELLEVERELGKVRADIESMTAQMRGLRDRVAMSTLTITCVQSQFAATEAVHFGEAMRGGWYLLLRSVAVALFAWPILLGAACVAIVWRLRHRGAPAAPPLPHVSAG